jgi:AraC-like DNA-binding protein
MRDDPATPAVELDEILRGAPLADGRRLRYGGGGAQTALVCGGFGLDEAAAHPILRALPSLVHIHGSVPWVAATLDLLSAEVASDAPGAEEVTSRLADALLAQALRVALAELDGSSALRDPQLAAAIARVHGQPGRAWTVGELAADIGLSRSAFAARFRELVGEPPRRYITRTRLAHAAALLHETDACLAEIAARTGYATEFSFGKAFKRRFGVAPGAYRRQPSARPGSSTSNWTSSP